MKQYIEISSFGSKGYWGININDPTRDGSGAAWINLHPEIMRASILYQPSPLMFGKLVLEDLSRRPRSYKQ